MVNINDREAAPYPGDKDVWLHIWKEQEQLHLHYRDIEYAKGIGYGILIAGDEYDIDNMRFQAYLKDMKWRFTEEMMEASEAQMKGDHEHFKEELTDALHFMMEMNVVLGIASDQLFVSSGTPGTSAIYFYGLAANCLKNKPWKQTLQRTDKNKYLSLIRQGNEKFRQQLLTVMNLEEIWDKYSRKNQVNQFRMESKY